MIRYPSKSGIVEVVLPSRWRAIICFFRNHTWEEGGTCARCGAKLTDVGHG